MSKKNGPDEQIPHVPLFDTMLTQPRSLKKNLIILGVIVIALGIVGLAAAAIVSASKPSSAEPASAELPSALDSLGIAGVQMQKRFDTEIDGVEGVVVSVQGEENLVYSMNGGRHVLIGMMLGEDGKNLTEGHAAKHFEAKPERPAQTLPQRDGNAIDAAAALDAAESLPFFIEEGTGETVLYVTLDPNCPHCANYYNASRSVLSDVTIRWVPVGYLGPDSLRQAGLLVDSDDPVAAAAQMNAQGLSGNPSPEARAVAQENSSIMREAGITMTPATIYRSADGTPRVVRGALSAERIRALR